jgi:SNF2 family DNA or RNA helicase
MGKFYKIATVSELKEHQQRVINKLKKQNALLVYHGVGSGKTLTALEAGEQLNLPVEVIGPAALKSNFAKEKAKHHVKVPLEYFSYNKPPDPSQINTGNKLLVFDEAHNMGRMESGRSHYPDEYYGKKTMFLTGTPIRNSPDEMIPIMRGLGINVPRDKQRFDNIFVEEIKRNPGFLASTFLGVKAGIEKVPKNISLFKELMEGRVDYYNPESTDYPSVIESTKTVEMSEKQYDTYKEMLKGNASLLYKVKHGLPPNKAESKSLNAFLSSSRQISNTPKAFNLSSDDRDEPKLNLAVEEITKQSVRDPNYRGVTYSNYIESGIAPMANRLDATGIPYGVFTGKQSDKQKKQIIEDYNAGRIKHLLISGAGAEGLDLKGTKLLQVLEPHWNDPRIDQVIGRAVRFQSHSHLPEKERVVQIQKFVALPRKHGFIFKERDSGSDEYLSMMSKQKSNLSNAFLNALKEVGD